MMSTYFTYDTIRYDIFTCAQELTRWPAIVREASPGERSETTVGKGRLGFMKQVGFKPGVMDKQSGDMGHRSINPVPRPIEPI